MWRYHPQTDALVRLARGGRAAAGGARRVRLRRSADDPGNVRLQGELEGGSLMDVGCYCVSALRLLGGEPVRVGGEAVGDEGVDVPLRRACCACPARCWARSTAASTCRRAAPSRSSARAARWCPRTRGTGSRRG